MACVITSTTYPATRGTGHKLFSGLDSTFQTVKGSAGTVNQVQIDNTLNTAAAVYVKFYDSAAPTVGTDAPELVLRAAAGALFNFDPLKGTAFATAITIAALTTGGTDGSTAPANTVVVRVVYT